MYTIITIKANSIVNTPLINSFVSILFEDYVMFLKEVLKLIVCASTNVLQGLECLLISDMVNDVLNRSIGMDSVLSHVVSDDID